MQSETYGSSVQLTAVWDPSSVEYGQLKKQLGISESHFLVSPTHV